MLAQKCLELAPMLAARVALPAVDTASVPGQPAARLGVDVFPVSEVEKLARAAAITDHGMTLTGAQGVAEAINFQEAGAGKVATTGDFVLIAEEVNPVISALEEHGIEVTALHSHMLTEQPRLFFMHFWTVGSTESVAAGIKAALSHVAVK